MILRLYYTPWESTKAVFKPPFFVCTVPCIRYMLWVDVFYASEAVDTAGDGDVLVPEGPCDGVSVIIQVSTKYTVGVE